MVETEIQRYLSPERDAVPVGDRPFSSTTDAEDIRVFVKRQGIAKLAAALHYARRVRAGEFTQRTAATRLDVHPVEGMTILTALQAVLDDAPAEEVAPTPDPDADPDPDA